MKAVISCNGKYISVDPEKHPDRLCYGQSCYLRFGCCSNNPDTVVPAHANLLELGKGKGLKVNDIYTVPACFKCHMELDQGKNMSKGERREAWIKAYNRWGRFRLRKYGLRFDPLTV